LREVPGRCDGLATQTARDPGAEPRENVVDHQPTCTERTEDGRRLPLLVWRFAEEVTVVSSAPVGGGIATASWLLNAQVAPGYARTDLAEHVGELAAAVGLEGTGVGLLTAADVGLVTRGDDSDVTAWATVGIRQPTWAAAPTDGIDAVWRPGTINVVVVLPVALSPAAAINAVATATEAKTQALLEAGVPGTGTATDALAVVCAPADRADVEPFAGPRSVWGGRLARAVHAAVAAGIPISAARLRAEQAGTGGGPR